MKYIRDYGIVVLPIFVSVALICLLNIAVISSKSNLPSLDVVPDSQNIYVLGNSMFGTGFSLSHARAKLPNKRVDFAYYNGHYTSMWHLAVTVGMQLRTAPDVLVWGFRPTYAVYPAFRQNRKTTQKEFSKHMNTVHRAILANAGDPAYSDSKGTSFAIPGTSFQSESDEIFEKMGSKIGNLIKDYVFALSTDAAILGSLIDNVALAVAELITSIGLPRNALFTDDELTKPSDLLIRYTTNGRIQVADAQVIDNGEKFIKGDAVSFSDSFLPETIREIQKLGSSQLVVIFKPISTFDAPLDDNVQQLYLDALEYMNENDIPFLDLMVVEDLSKEMYAEGDHLNESGRIFVTDLIVERLH
ncbi:MAG: hypothetical protein ACI9CE_002072 [Flavobacterium sp.]|jgi:hypothetical protein